MTTDMSEAKDMCLKLAVALDELDGLGADNRKKPQSDKGRISADLLYAVHCADLVRAEILSQYHVFKGRTDVPMLAAA